MYKIAAGPNQSYIITVPNADALANLLRGQTYKLPRHDGVEMISYEKAQQMAVNSGLSIPSSSLRSACQRKTIPGAEKVKGRWQMPEDQFREWAGIPAANEPEAWQDSTKWSIPVDPKDWKPASTHPRSDEEILFSPATH